MKKAIIGLLVTIGSAIALTATASAAGYESHSSQVEHFDGTFQGRIYGDKGSSAPIVLELNQEGRVVEGTVEMGRGLYVNGGMCGSGYVPGGVQSAAGQVSATNPRQVNAAAAFKVSGLTVNIDLTGLASANGQEVETQAKIDLPWLCGRDPVLSGTLFRTQ
jgi:hypothetical protein